MEDKSSTHVEKPASIPDGWENQVSRRRILVVDDDDDIRRFNAEALTGSGYHVDTAVDGAEGWEALAGSCYDLMITDNNMPKLSGIELIKKLKAARIAVPVILASGVEHTEVAELHLAATLSKPFTLDELLGTVKKVLDKAGSGEWQAPASNGPPAEPWGT
jgi:DNA-binding response OmpR family regulator